MIIYQRNISYQIYDWFRIILFPAAFTENFNKKPIRLRMGLNVAKSDYFSFFGKPSESFLSSLVFSRTSKYPSGKF